MPHLIVGSGISTIITPALSVVLLLRSRHLTVLLVGPLAGDARAATDAKRRAAVCTPPPLGPG